MRHFLLLILTFLSLNPPSWAQTPQERWTGFRTADEIRDLNLPFQEFVENSVYMIVTVGLTETVGETVEILDMQNDPRALNVITDKKTLTYEPLHFQVETCRKQNLRFCPIFKVNVQGTMFFNQGKLYTCRHNFHNWLSLAAKANNVPVNELSPPIILKQPNKKKPGRFTVIYQSAFKSEPLLKFSLINNDPRLNFQMESLKYTDARSKLIDWIDFVEMTPQSTKYLTDTSIPVRKNEVGFFQKNEEMFILGYPGPTNNFLDPRENSPGNTLLISTGHVLTQLPPTPMIDSSAYSSVGSSGSAVVSASGELLGVHCTGVERGTPEESTASFIPLDQQLISASWEKIDYSVLGTEQAQSDTTN